LLWAALKFDQRIVTSAIVLMAALAVWGAKHGYGPFVQLNANVTLLLLMSFVGTSSLMTLLVAAVTTERRKAEAEKSNARQQAEEASRLKEEFLATVSHELRTPLNAVVGWSKLLRSGQLDADGALHAVEVIERNAAAQRQIIEDLLDVSRIVTGKLRISTRPVDLLLVIHAAIDAVRPAAEVGLAIVRHLVELHGGTVSATNRGQNGGAVLTVRLPAMVGPRIFAEQRG